MFRGSDTIETLRDFPFRVRNKKKSPVWCPLDPYTTIMAVRDYLEKDGCRPELVSAIVGNSYRAGAAFTATPPAFADVAPYRRCIAVTISNDVQASSRSFFTFYRGDSPGFVVGATGPRSRQGHSQGPEAFARKSCETFYDATFDLNARLAVLKADTVSSPRTEKALIDAVTAFPGGWVLNKLPAIMKQFGRSRGTAYDLLGIVADAVRGTQQATIPYELHLQLCLHDALVATRGMWAEDGRSKRKQR